MGPARLVLPLLLLAGCAAAPEPPPLWLAERGLVWCYRTLADPDCYDSPLAGAERRLIATAPQVYYTPAIDDPARAYSYCVESAPVIRQ